MNLSVEESTGNQSCADPPAEVSQRTYKRLVDYSLHRSDALAPDPVDGHYRYDPPSYYYHPSSKHAHRSLSLHAPTHGKVSRSLRTNRSQDVTHLPPLSSSLRSHRTSKCRRGTTGDLLHRSATSRQALDAIVQSSRQALEATANLGEDTVPCFPTKIISGYRHITTGAPIDRRAVDSTAHFGTSSNPQDPLGRSKSKSRRKGTRRSSRLGQSQKSTTLDDSAKCAKKNNESRQDTVPDNNTDKVSLGNTSTMTCTVTSTCPSTGSFSSFDTRDNDRGSKMNWLANNVSQRNLLESTTRPPRVLKVIYKNAEQQQLFFPSENDNQGSKSGFHNDFSPPSKTSRRKRRSHRSRHGETSTIPGSTMLSSQPPPARNPHRMSASETTYTTRGSRPMTSSSFSTQERRRRSSSSFVAGSQITIRTVGAVGGPS